MFAPFYHVGIIVPELAEAKRGLTATLGLDWASDQRREMQINVDGELVDRDIRFVYSTGEPPHVELIEANLPPWELRDGLHHIGVWSEDIAADIEKYAAEKYRIRASGLNRKKHPGGFAYLSSPSQLLVELVDTRGKPAFDRWLAGGDFA